MQERNISSYWKRVGGRQVYLKAIFKKVPKIVLEKTGKPATPEFIEGATKTFGFWCLGTLEQIKRGQ
tara:strand:- start:90 stop:290 length:201 start_codon:yes stop_codon:yes gene_type:complete